MIDVDDFVGIRSHVAACGHAVGLGRALDTANVEERKGLWREPRSFAALEMLWVSPCARIYMRYL